VWHLGGTQTFHPHPVAALDLAAATTGDLPLALVDLHLTFEQLRRLAVQEAERSHWLDALLLTAASGQVLDDHLHHSKTWPKRLHEQLAHADRPAVRRAGGGVRRGLDLAGAARSRRPGHRRRATAREGLYELTVELAARTLGTATSDDGLAERLAAVLGDDGPWTAALERSVIVLPSAFRSFDQHPRDLLGVARQVAVAHPDRTAPVAVFGVRTSGSYLGPLLAAALRREGFADVRFDAIRPDDHLDRRQRLTVEAVTGGLAVLVDDPPVSGDSLAESADRLVAAGMAPERVLIALAIDDPAGTVPPVLADRPHVVLPLEDWHLPTLMTADVVRPTLQQLLGDQFTVVALAPVPWPGPPAPAVPSTAHRDHRRAAFTVDLLGAGPDAVVETRMLLVESTGQGLFGRHAVAIADALPGRVPTSIGFAAGLHLQWLPVDASPADPTAAEVVDHLIARHEALAVGPDPSADFEGRQCVVEVATELLAGNLGPAGPPARLRLVAGAVRRVLRVGDASVVDGRVTLDRFLRGPDGALLKLDAAEGAFSHRDLATYDPAFDVAQLAEEPIGAEVRSGWEQRTGQAIEPERWLLHRLVHGWDRGRHRQATPDALRRATARALQGYLAETVMPDRVEAADGSWVALDVDGVLEGPVLDVSAPGRAGATALAALLSHGHRVALVTGRTVADVADRVGAWGLAGGVAEYGTALVLGGEVVDLRAPDEVARMDRLRAALGELVDPGHAHGVRTTRPLDDAELDGLDLDGLTVVPGEGQTDFVPAGCGKASGLKALLDRLDPSGAVALAVGDGPADLDLLDLAERPFLPHHARKLARPGHRVTRRAYQAGLTEAVTDLLGHEPGACDRCARREDRATRFVLDVLSLREAGPRGLPTRLVRVGRSAWRAGKPEERRSAPS
jgi:phosphoserine phosphatase